jgi:hypothetical protein
MDLLSATATVDKTLGLAFDEAPNLPTAPTATDSAQMVAEMSKMMASLR